VVQRSVKTKRCPIVLYNGAWCKCNFEACQTNGDDDNTDDDDDVMLSVAALKTLHLQPL